MADDQLPDSTNESDETKPTEPTGTDATAEAGATDQPAELTADGEISDPRDTPDDAYVDDPSTPDINEAKLDRATDEVAEDDDAVAINPIERRRSRANRPVRKAKSDKVVDEPAEELLEEDIEPVEPEPARIGSGRARPTAPVRRERSTTETDTGKRTTPAKFVAESVGELRKVVWPTGNQVQQYFIVVLVFVLFIMTVVTLLDLGFGWVILRVFGGAQ